MNNYSKEGRRKTAAAFQSANAANQNNDNLEVYIRLNAHAPMSAYFEMYKSLIIKYHDYELTYGECPQRGEYFQVTAEIKASMLGDFRRELETSIEGFQSIELTENCDPAEHRQYRRLCTRQFQIV